MKKRIDRRQQLAYLKVRRWMREIVLAVILTVAAVTVITVTLWRGDGVSQDAVPLARKQ